MLMCCLGFVLTSEEISVEPLFPRQGRHVRGVSIEWSQHEPLRTQ